MQIYANELLTGKDTEYRDNPNRYRFIIYIFFYFSFIHDLFIILVRPIGTKRSKLTISEVLLYILVRDP